MRRIVQTVCRSLNHKCGYLQVALESALFIIIVAPLEQRISLMHEHDASPLLLRGARVTILTDNDLCSFRFRFEEVVHDVVVENKQSILLALESECEMNESRFGALPDVATAARLENVYDSLH